MTAPTEYLTPYEHTRRALHHAIDRICNAWPQALEDANSRGYPSGVDYNVRKTGSDTTSVEAAALNPSKAVAWLAELGELVSRVWDNDLTVRHGDWFPELSGDVWSGYLHTLATEDGIGETDIRVTIRLANTACLLWPPPPKPGQHLKLVGKPFDSETCLYCQTPAYPGDRRAIKLADGTIEVAMRTKVRAGMRSPWDAGDADGSPPVPQNAFGPVPRRRPTLARPGRLQRYHRPVLPAARRQPGDPESQKSVRRRCPVRPVMSRVRPVTPREVRGLGWDVGTATEGASPSAETGRRPTYEPQHDA